ncbi:hypothetical protein FRC04_002483 [Tulasnella sp. 424]|nr:hypothetical protein FRC04_002483 [Tulasnella sp. 424]
MKRWDLDNLDASAPASAPSQVPQADSLSVEYNITWAGQTMGQQYASNGRLYDDASIQTDQCNTTAGLCNIPAPIPSVALVFLSDEALTNSGGVAGDASGSNLTFAPTSTSTSYLHLTLFPPLCLSFIIFYILCQALSLIIP